MYGICIINLDSYAFVNGLEGWYVMSKKDNTIITLRDDCIIIKDKVNDKKYKIVLSGREGIELRVGQLGYVLKDGNMKRLPIKCGDKWDNDIIMYDVYS